MLFLVIAAVLSVVVVAVHVRVGRLISAGDEAADPPALLSGQDATERILARAGVSVSLVEGDVDCYSFLPGERQRRQIQLADGRLDRRSLSAVTIGAHEAAHAIQHASGWRLFTVDTTLAVIAFFAGPIGIALAAVGWAMGWHELFYAAGALFTVCGVAGVTRTVVEVDASRLALDELRALELEGYDERAARQLLLWCGATYVVDSVFDLAAITRRTQDLVEDLGGGRSDWGDGAGDSGGGSSGCGGGGGGGD